MFRHCEEWSNPALFSIGTLLIFLSPMKILSSTEQDALLSILQIRFESNMHRHSALSWESVRAKLEGNPEKFSSLSEMERTWGEPDVVSEESGSFAFYDCAPESPSGRRSLCYDRVALDTRKENKPKWSADEMAREMGIELLTEAEYRKLQTAWDYDLKTSSWIGTPIEIRKLGGALFCDRRYDGLSRKSED